MDEPESTVKLSSTFYYYNLIREGCPSKEKITPVLLKVFGCIGWCFKKVFLFFTLISNIILDVEFLSLFHHEFVLLVDLLPSTIVV